MSRNCDSTVGRDVGNGVVFKILKIPDLEIIIEIITDFMRNWTFDYTLYM